MNRLDALVELLGPAWGDVLGDGDYNKTALAVLERYADPRGLKRLGRKRLTALMIRTSRGAWRDTKADELLGAAEETLALWASGGLDFAELAEDIASETRVVRLLDNEITELDDRISALYDDADPKGIIASGPGLGTTLAAAILGRLGDPDRFNNLAGVRSFTGLVPRVDQSGITDRHGPPTKAGDPGLREALFLAADHARKVDPTLAARYRRLVIDQGKHHNSALCHLAAVLATRLAACWRRSERYELRDVDGRGITVEEGREICTTRYKITADERGSRRHHSHAADLKQRASRRKEESTKPLRQPARPTTKLPAELLDVS